MIFCCVTNVRMGFFVKFISDKFDLTRSILGVPLWIHQWMMFRTLRGMSCHVFWTTIKTTGGNHLIVCRWVDL
jgi:hypothetical protein